MLEPFGGEGRLKATFVVLHTGNIVLLTRNWPTKSQLLDINTIVTRPLCKKRENASLVLHIFGPVHAAKPWNSSVAFGRRVKTVLVSQSGSLARGTPESMHDRLFRRPSDYRGGYPVLELPEAPWCYKILVYRRNMQEK